MQRHLLVVLFVGLAAAVPAAQSTPSRSTPAVPAASAALEATIAAYAAAWGEPDVEARRKLLLRVWADKGTYADPTVQLAGREALVQHITGFLAGLPGARVVPTSRVDAHHGSIRFSWRILSGSGTALSEGMDYGEVDATGHITRIVGFFGPLESSPREGQ
jgi:hypothetical protein